MSPSQQTKILYFASVKVQSQKNVGELATNPSEQWLANWCKITYDAQLLLEACDRKYEFVTSNVRFEEKGLC